MGNEMLCTVRKNIFCTGLAIATKAVGHPSLVSLVQVAAFFHTCMIV